MGPVTHVQSAAVISRTDIAGVGRFAIELSVRQTLSRQCDVSGSGSIV